MTDPTREQVTKLAAEHYAAALEAGDHFTVDEVTEAVTDDLLGRYSDGDQVTVRDLILMLADREVRKVDQERRRPDEAPTLFDDLDHPIAVAGNQRIARRWMLTDDWAAHLEHVNGNRERVNRRADLEQKRFSALSRYLSQGLTTAEALDVWQADNPDGTLP